MPCQPTDTSDVYAIAARPTPERQSRPAAKVTEPPLLVVEVQSPSTALIDLNVKKAAYERFGIGRVLDCRA